MSANAASLSASFRPADTATSAFTWGRYARTGLLTIGASVFANAVFFYLSQVVVQHDPAFLPLGNVSAPIIFTVFPAVVAALLYAGLLQFVRKHAAMVFTVIAAIKAYLDNHNQNPRVFVWSAPVERILAKIAKCKEALDSLH